MRAKKKIVGNTVFLLAVFGLTLYGVFHGEDLDAMMEGRVCYHLVYDAFLWDISKEEGVFFVFFSRILF